MELTTPTTLAVSSCLAFAFGLYFLLTTIYGPNIPTHRCWISECEPSSSRNFSAEWLKYAIPFKNGYPEPCRRYQYIEIREGADKNHSCSAQNFNASNAVYCKPSIIRNRAGYTFSRVDILCRGENVWLSFLRMTLIIGRFVALPAVAIVALKIGRLLTIIGFFIITVICTYLQMLPATFDFLELYLLLEFLVSLSSTGLQGVSFLIDAEWMSSNHVILEATLTALLDIFYVYAAIGVVSNWFEDSSIANKLMFAVPMWLVPLPKTIKEKLKSVDNVKIETKSVMHIRSIQELSIEYLRSQSANTSIQMTDNDVVESNKVTLRDLLKHKILALRLLILFVVWLLLFFACFGIVWKSTNTTNTSYISYVIVGVANIPCALFTMFLLNRIGRRRTISSAMLIYGLVLVLSSQISIGLDVCNVISLVVSKAAITTTMIGMGAYSTEFWPTTSRNTVYGICKLIGRLGNILAASTSVFAEHYVHSPELLYAFAAVLGAGLLILFLPETGTCDKLPDTIDEALAIGKKT